MKEPLLMPFQEFPFNGDFFIEQEFLKLKERFNIKTVVETGTCLGYTTIWLAKNFQNVYTVEINENYHNIAIAKFINWPNVYAIHGNSEIAIHGFPLGGSTIYYLDAHWNNSCPLINELKVIARLGIKPVIAIHDFFFPGSSLGFDSYKGQPFTFEWLKDSFNLIYGKQGYDYYYNSDELSAGAKRGIIYLTPKTIL